eukprot:5105441-Amphidinium_carterae.1
MVDVVSVQLFIVRPSVLHAQQPYTLEVLFQAHASTASVTSTHPLRSARPAVSYSFYVVDACLHESLARAAFV